jgi:hypothetical protein
MNHSSLIVQSSIQPKQKTLISCLLESLQNLEYSKQAKVGRIYTYLIEKILCGAKGKRRQYEVDHLVHKSEPL